MEPTMYESIALGDLRLDNGRILIDAHIGYAHWGLPASSDATIIILPSYYSGTVESYAPWIGSTSLFDPACCCIIAFDQFGAGKSSKPSDTPQNEWPVPSLNDCVRAQKRALDKLGVDHIDLVAGWSMGGMHVFSWCLQFPQFIRNALAICATPIASEVNRVFLEGVRATLAGDLDPCAVGALDEISASERAHRLRAFGATYAGWAYSNEFFLSGAYREFSYENSEAVVSGWAADHEKMDAADLTAQLDAWLHAKLPSPPPAFTRKETSVRVVAMPSSTDRYFLTETLDGARKAFPKLDIVEMQSDLGHIAGRPGIRAYETRLIKEQVDRLLFSNSRHRPPNQARGTPG